MEGASADDLSRNQDECVEISLPELLAVVLDELNQQLEDLGSYEQHQIMEQSEERGYEVFPTERLRQNLHEVDLGPV